MAARGVSLLKFVGTVSLGLLTGLSYSLSTLTIPALLALPSASAAAKGFESLAATAKRHLRALTAVSGSAFLLAFVLSPRSYRHPYLLYTSALVFGSHLATSDLVAPYLSLGPATTSATTTTQTSSSSSSSAAAAAERKQLREHAAAAARARMEASYEVLGSGGSDAHSEGTVEAGDDAASIGSATEAEQQQEQENNINGEEVRVKVETFLKKQIVQSTVAGLGFLMSIVGIWGDAVVTPVYETVLLEI